MKKQDNVVIQKVLDDKLDELKSWFVDILKANSEEDRGWMDKRLDETFYKYRDELMTRVDEWAGYAKKNYEETEVISHRVTSHEERIEKLETAVFSN